MTHKFKIGDRVRVAKDVDPGWFFKKGDTGTVHNVTFPDSQGITVNFDGSGGDWGHVYADMIEPITNTEPTSSVLGTQVGGSHYTDCAIQPIEYIWANKLPFSEGNIIKYVTQWRAKGGIKDLEKAKHHLELMIEHERTEQAEAKGAWAKAAAKASPWQVT